VFRGWENLKYASTIRSAIILFGKLNSSSPPRSWPSNINAEGDDIAREFAENLGFCRRLYETDSLGMSSLGEQTLVMKSKVDDCPKYSDDSSIGSPLGCFSDTCVSTYGLSLAGFVSICEEVSVRSSVCVSLTGI
jgi:hypothetical protein